MTISKRAAAHRWVTVGVWDSAVILSVVVAWLRCDAGQADCYAAAVLWVFNFRGTFTVELLIDLIYEGLNAFLGVADLWNICCGTSMFSLSVWCMLERPRGGPSEAGVDKRFTIYFAIWMSRQLFPVLFLALLCHTYSSKLIANECAYGENSVATGTEPYWVEISFWQSSEITTGDDVDTSVPDSLAPHQTLEYSWSSPEECWVWWRQVSGQAELRLNVVHQLMLINDEQTGVATLGFTQNSQTCCNEFSTDGTDKTYHSNILEMDPSTSQTGNVLYGAVTDFRMPVTELQLIGDRFINTETTLAFTVSAVDANSDSDWAEGIPAAHLSYALDQDSVDLGATISDDGQFSWTPSAAAIGNHTVTVTVTNDLDTSTDSETFTISVLLESIVGKQFEYQPDDASLSVPFQELYGEDGYVSIGFSGSVIERAPYSIAEGAISLPNFNEEIRLSFTDQSSGTYQFAELEGDSLVVDETGTFTILEAPSLEEISVSDWQRTEAFDSPLNPNYWNIWRRSQDAVTTENGDLNFVFEDAGADDLEAEVMYGRTLPLDDSWQVVLEDVYADSSLDWFNVELDLAVEEAGFECGLGFGLEDDVLRVYVWCDGDFTEGGFYAYVSASNDDQLASSGAVNLRVRYDSVSRDMLFEYQAVEVGDWTEFARLNLETGAFTDDGEQVDAGSGEVLSDTLRMSMEIDVDSGAATDIGNLVISGIEIEVYEPVSDSDFDGLSDEDEVNLHGSDPNQYDTSGDGFSDGLLVEVGADPTLSYSASIFAQLVLDQTQELRIGAEIVTVENNKATLQIVLEESADLISWSERETIPVEVELQAEETAKFFRYAMQGDSE
jgi:hypothetical protein